MSDHNMEPKIKELMELKRMKEELEAEITTLEDEIKARMGDEETLLAGAFKVSWKPYTASRLQKRPRGACRSLHQNHHGPAVFHQLKSLNTYHSIQATPHK